MNDENTITLEKAEYSKTAPHVDYMRSYVGEGSETVRDMQKMEE